MKQVEQSYRTGKLRVVEAPAPLVPTGGVLVATRVSLISAGTEKQIVDLAKSSLAGKAAARPDLVRQVWAKMRQEGVSPTVRKVLARLDTPIPLGYSLAGEVIGAGERAQGLKIGDRVACAGAGQANHAEFNAVPKNLCARIPDGVTDEDASFVTVGAIALQGVRVAQPTLGERFVVSGLGLIGQLTVQLLKANGCRVLGYDPNPSRVVLARALGADLATSDDLPSASHAFTDGHGADAVIVTASTKSSGPVNAAASISRMKGRVVLVGLTGTTIDREPFYRRELELRLSMSYGPGRYDPAYERHGHDYPIGFVRWTEQRNMQAFLELVADGRVTPAKLVTHRFAIADAPLAYALMETDEPYLAILLTYPEEPAPTSRTIIVSGPMTAPRPGALGVGFIGFGAYAKSVLLPAVRKSGVKLTTVVTATGLSALNGAETHGFARAATDPAALLEDPDTDVVFIATRHSTHARLTIDALNAGKHVFCEKPLALDDEELDAVVQAARGNTTLLTVGFNRRHAPMMVAAKQALSGRAGPLAMLYRVNAGAVPGDSWLNTDEGGGRVLGEVCHFVDALTFLAGSSPVSVRAVAAGHDSDAVSVLLSFADGSSGAIVYATNGDASVPKEYLEAFGDGRVIQLENFRRLSVTRHGRTTVTKARSQDKGQVGATGAFLDAIRCGAAPPIPLEELAAVTAATIAVGNSVRAGREVGLRDPLLPP